MSADIRTGSLVDSLTGLVAADADAVALSQALDPEIQAVATLAEQCAFFSRVPSLTAEQADEVGRWFRLTDLEGWAAADIVRKRAVLLEMVDVYRRRGTRWALERMLGILDRPVVEWDGGGAIWDDGDAVWDIQVGMYSVEEWWERTPPDPPFTYRVDAEVLHYGLSLAELRQLAEVLDAYVPVRAHLLELSETIPIESTLVCGGYPELGLHIEVL